jgi:hypothetical protein
MDWFLLLCGVALTLMTVGPGSLIVLWAKRRTATRAILAMAATVAGIFWLLELYRAMAGAGDLDGMFDCYPDCSASQEAAWAVLGYHPVAMGALLLLVLLTGVVGRLRLARSGHRYEPRG